MVALTASEVSTDRAGLRCAARSLGAACAAVGATLVLGGAGAWPTDLADTHRLSSFAEFHALLAQTPRR